jgi:hypothetical protein
MNAHLDTAVSAHLWDMGLRVLDSSLDVVILLRGLGAVIQTSSGCIHGFDNADADATA